LRDGPTLTTDISNSIYRKEDFMGTHRLTPNIEVSIGRELRLYHAYVTTAPAKLDAPATITLYAAPLSDVSGMAADPMGLASDCSKTPARLVLVNGSELEWQQARYREAKHLFTRADPVLLGLGALQHWLWNRICAPHPDLELSGA
jgi:hypothetical protein